MGREGLRGGGSSKKQQAVAASRRRRAASLPSNETNLLLTRPSLTRQQQRTPQRSVANFKGEPMLTSAGAITAATLTNASIS